MRTPIVVFQCFFIPTKHLNEGPISEHIAREEMNVTPSPAARKSRAWSCNNGYGSKYVNPQNWMVNHVANPGCHKATNWGWFMANEPNLQQFSTKWVVLPWSLGTISESNWRLKSDSFQQGHSPQTNDWIIFVLIPGYVHFGSFWNYFLVKERVPTWRFPNCAQKKNDAHKNNLP